MLPVRDDNPTSTTPVVNRALIIVNSIVFLIQLLLGERFIVDWAFIPARFTALLNGSLDIGAALTVISSMFMHGSFGHIFGNMLFLWLFGDNVEDAYGHGPYLIFYLVCGVVASMAQYFSGPNSMIVNLGASGAIGGVMGAYILMYPKARVQLFFWPFSVFLGTLPVPAWLMLGFWFFAQLTPALQALGDINDRGGVAYWAHVGGFLAGLVLTLILRPHCRRAPVFHNADLYRRANGI